MNKLIKNLALFSLVVSFSGCDYYQSYMYRKHIKGVWLLQDYGRGYYSHSILSFLPDGTKCVIAYEFSPNGVVEFDYYFNTYTIEDNQLITRVKKSNSGVLYSEYEIQDEIKELGLSKMVLLMKKPESSNPRLENHVRLIDENPERICGLVKEQLGLN